MTIEDKDPNTVFDAPRTFPSGQATPAQFTAAFKEIFGESYETLSLYAMRYALKLTRGNAADAEDLVQDAFVRILRASYTRPIQNWRGWVSRILLRLHLGVVERRKTQTDKLGVRTGFDIAVDEDVRDRTGEDPADIVTESVFSTEIRDRVTAVIGSVLKDQRIVLQAMLDFDNGELRSCRDIEVMTGFSNSKVKRLRAAVGPLLIQALADLAGRDDPRNLA